MTVPPPHSGRRCAGRPTDGWGVRVGRRRKGKILFANPVLLSFVFLHTQTCGRTFFYRNGFVAIDDDYSSVDSCSLIQIYKWLNAGNA